MSDITLPPVHNLRAPEQWEIISQAVNFRGKTVLDLGCGYGDILLRCCQAGADCLGVDIEPHLIDRSLAVSETIAYHFRLMDFAANLDRLPPWSDVIICFSVLPYLANRAEVLAWIKKHSSIALIECQYAGDGPGLDFLKNDTDMLNWLRSFGWQSIEKIGETMVEGRNMSRSIWKCEG